MEVKFNIEFPDDKHFSIIEVFEDPEIISLKNIESFSMPTDEDAAIAKLKGELIIKGRTVSGKEFRFSPAKQMCSERYMYNSHRHIYVESGNVDPLLCFKRILLEWVS